MIPYAWKWFIRSWSGFAVILGATFIALLPAIVSADDGVTDVANNSAAIQQWEFILGFLQPLIASLVIQSGWSRTAQSIVSFLLAVATTTIGLWLQGDFNGVTDWVTSVLTVFALSITAYYGLWKPTGVAPKIESATST